MKKLALPLMPRSAFYFTAMTKSYRAIFSKSLGTRFLEKSLSGKISISYDNIMCQEEEKVYSCGIIVC
jgi:hypothetical protein